jgi:hypothetical protein
MDPSPVDVSFPSYEALLAAPTLRSGVAPVQAG